MQFAPMQDTASEMVEIYLSGGVNLYCNFNRV